MASWILDEDALRYQAEDVLNKLLAMQNEARRVRAKLKKEGFDPNQIMLQQMPLSEEDKTRLYSLVRPMILIFPVDLLIAKFQSGNYEFLAELDLVAMESVLWIKFSGRVKRYDTKRSAAKPATFTTYLYACFRKAYIQSIEEAKGSSKPMVRTQKITNRCVLTNREGEIGGDDFYDEASTLWMYIRSSITRRQYKILWGRVVEGRSIQALADELRLTKDYVKTLEDKAVRRLKIREFLISARQTDSPN